jgi:RND family efflux transporter MFP subunit
MKRFYWSVFSAFVILTVSTLTFGASVDSVFAAPGNNVIAQKTVTASAVVVPAQVSELGFLISGIARDIPVQEGDTVEAGQTLMVLDTPNLRYAVDEAEAGLRGAQAQAEIKTNDIVKKYIINYEKFTVRKLKLSVRRAQAVLEGAQARQAQGTLVAPFDGTVTSLSVIPGEFVKSNQSVLTLATLDHLQFETTDLSERDIPNVQIGDPVNIFIEALNKNITGKVVSISPKAEIIGGDVTYKVTIAPDSQPEGLLWGMTAEVDIQSGK